MKKRPIDDSPERLREVWLAFEYPGRLLRRDIARMGRLLKRVYAGLMGRKQLSASEEERDNHLWAERRE